MAEREFRQYAQDVSESGDVRVGVPLSLGVHQRGDGVNFAIFSRHATQVRLELFDRPGDGVATGSVALDPTRHRTGDVWHVWVKGVHPGQLYAYRIEGPYRPQEGQRFNPNKLLLDPCATAITGRADWDFRPARGYDPSSPQADLSYSELDDAQDMPKSVFTHGYFDWEGDRVLGHSWSMTVIYELHVRGFTVHDSAGVRCPGTYRGLVEKIPYLQRLGVTAVELMPVQEFNEHESVRVNPSTGERLRNYWGYSPVAFLAPKASFCSSGGWATKR